MANPTLNEKRFETIQKEDEAGWAAPVALAHSEAAAGPPPTTRVAHMTANGTFAKTFVLFLIVLAGGAVGWSQTTLSSTNQIEIPWWTWLCLLVGVRASPWCACSSRRRSPFMSPLYAIVEGVALGAISKAFEIQWDGIVFQAVLATIGVFFATLALYVFGVVKVTRRFQMVVIGATFGILLLYGFGFLLSLFGVDVVFWNQPSALGIIVSVVICCVASLNLFLDYEFIRQASINGAPKYMEWYGAFGIMVTLVWIYIEMLRLLSLLRR